LTRNNEIRFFNPLSDPFPANLFPGNYFSKEFVKTVFGERISPGKLSIEHSLFLYALSKTQIYLREILSKIGYLFIHIFTVLSRLLMTTSLVFVFKFYLLVFPLFLLEYVPMWRSSLAAYAFNEQLCREPQWSSVISVNGSTAAVGFSQWLSSAGAGLFRVHCRLSACLEGAYIVRPAFQSGWRFRTFQLLPAVSVLFSGLALGC